MDSIVFTSICEQISEGLSVTAACRVAQVDKSTFFRHLANHPENRDKYARAREIRADSHFEEVADIKEDLRNKVITPDVGRLLIDAIKWQCGKESPKRYGERLELAGDADNPLTVSWAETLRERRARRAKEDK